MIANDLDQSSGFKTTAEISREYFVSPVRIKYVAYLMYWLFVG